MHAHVSPTCHSTICYLRTSLLEISIFMPKKSAGRNSKDVLMWQSNLCKENTKSHAQQKLNIFNDWQKNSDGISGIQNVKYV